MTTTTELAKVARTRGLTLALLCLDNIPKTYDKQIVALGCDFAEHVLHQVPAGEDRPRKALEVARAWLRGHATWTEAREAANDAREAADALLDSGATHCAAFCAVYAASAVFGGLDYVASCAAVYSSDAAERAWQLARFLEWCDENKEPAR